MKCGIDRLLTEPGLRRPLAGRRIALLAHPASVTRDLAHSMDALATDLFQNTYLSQAVAPEVIAENNRDLATQLGSLRFYDLNRQCPTNAGILLFGKNPLQWLPGSYIQFLRLEGSSLTGEVLVEKSLSGDLLTVLRELERQGQWKMDCFREVRHF